MTYTVKFNFINFVSITQCKKIIIYLIRILVIQVMRESTEKQRMLVIIDPLGQPPGSFLQATNQNEISMYKAPISAH